MGWRERRDAADILDGWVADAGHVKLTDAERLVALEVIDQCHEQTGLAYGRDLLARMARRCGMDEKRFRRILGQVAQKGLALRVQIGVDSNGAGVYAHRGRQTTYQLPALWPADAPRKGHTDVPLSGPVDNSEGVQDGSPFGEKGVRHGHERGTGASRKGYASVAPTTEVPLSTKLASEPTSKRRRDKIDRIIDKWAPDLNRDTVAKYLTEQGKGLGVLAAAETDGTILDLFAKIRAWAAPTVQPRRFTDWQPARPSGCGAPGCMDEDPDDDYRPRPCAACQPQRVNGHHP